MGESVSVTYDILGHSSLPNPSVDLGARGCELLYILSGFLIASNYTYFGGGGNKKSLYVKDVDTIQYVLGKRSKLWVLNIITIPVFYVLHIFDMQYICQTSTNFFDSN